MLSESVQIQDRHCPAVVFLPLPSAHTPRVYLQHLCVPNTSSSQVPICFCSMGYPVTSLKRLKPSPSNAFRKDLPDSSAADGHRSGF